MKLVTDSGADMTFAPERRAAIDVEVIPLSVTLDGKTYQEGVDIEHKDFYPILENAEGLPTTSQPPAGQFAEIYRKLAKAGEEILSIHISSGLSGTFNSAIQGAKMVKEATITHFDAQTLSAAVGWMVEAASKGIKAGWTMEQIIKKLEEIRAASDSIYTLNDLTYLINGGRISQMKGLIASMLNIKPIIGVEKGTGIYEQLGQVRTFKKALDGLVVQMTKKYAPSTPLRVQVLHSWNPEGAAILKEKIAAIFDCDFLPTGPMSLTLGAHTGRSMVGVAYAPQSVFANLP